MEVERDAASTSLSRSPILDTGRLPPVPIFTSPRGNGRNGSNDQQEICDFRAESKTFEQHEQRSADKGIETPEWYCGYCGSKFCFKEDLERHVCSGADQAERRDSNVVKGQTASTAVDLDTSNETGSDAPAPTRERAATETAVGKKPHRGTGGRDDPIKVDSSDEE